MGHAKNHFHTSDKEPLGATLTLPAMIMGGLGVICLIGALVLAALNDRWGHFGHGYLTAFSFGLAITLGSMGILVITTLFRAGWIVCIRRWFEVVASNIPILFVLALPLLVMAWMGGDKLYMWAQPNTTTYTQYHAAHDLQHNVAHEYYASEGAEHHSTHAGHEEAGAHAEESHVQHETFVNGYTEEAHHDWLAAQGFDVSLSGIDRADTVLGAEFPGGDYAKNNPAVALAQSRASFYSVAEYMEGYKGNDGSVESQEGHGFGWLTKPWWTVRVIGFFIVWAVIGTYYYMNSIRQDKTGDKTLTNGRERWAPLSVILFAVTLTLASFDLIMSIDHNWYSTIFGVYFFANAMLTALSVCVLVLIFVQFKGGMKTVTTEHYHDICKLMFAFTFFWGYIAYSQYMLIWYANLPETTYWFELRGATTLNGSAYNMSNYTWLTLALLFGHLFIPFAFLLSKHVKRNRMALAVAAVWILVFCYLDFWWLIMPMYSFRNPDGLATMAQQVDIALPLMELLCLVGVVGIMMAVALFRYGLRSPIPHSDPRLYESVQLDTNVWAPLYHAPDEH